MSSTSPAWEAMDLDGVHADGQLPVSDEDAHRHLQPRPIYHHKRESIEAPLTVVFTASRSASTSRTRPGGAPRNSCGLPAATAPSRSKSTRTRSPQPTRYLTTSPRPSKRSAARAALRTN